MFKYEEVFYEQFPKKFTEEDILKFEELLLTFFKDLNQCARCLSFCLFYVLSSFPESGAFTYTFEDKKIVFNNILKDVIEIIFYKEE